VTPWAESGDSPSELDLLLNQPYDPVAAALTDGRSPSEADIGPETARFLMNQARSAGRWLEVLAWADRADPCTESLGSDDQEAETTVVAARLAAHRMLGDYPEALRICTHERETRRNLSDEDQAALGAIAGECLLRLDRHEEVEAWLPENHIEDSIRARLVLSIALSRTGETEKATTLAASYSAMVGSDPYAADLAGPAIENEEGDET